MARSVSGNEAGKRESLSGIGADSRNGNGKSGIGDFTIDGTEFEPVEPVVGIDSEDDGATDGIDPDSIGERTGEDRGGSDGRKRRSDAGQKRGTRGGKRRSKNTTSTSEILGRSLYALHQIVATYANSPTFAITEDESKMLAQAAHDLGELYEVKMPSEKAQAWTQLIVVLGTVYGPRAADIFVNAEPEVTSPKHPSREAISIAR